MVRNTFKSPPTPNNPIKILEACVPKPETNFQFEPITPEVVFKSIKNLKSSKSTGPDNISSIFVKKILRICANAVCHLTNNIIHSGTFPKKFKTSRLLPLKKQGKPCLEMALYRPINNLSVINKLVEDILTKQLNDYFEKNQILKDRNHGGRLIHSTLSAHALIQAIINLQMDTRKASAIICTDISSAFELIDIDLFDRKFEYYVVKQSSRSLITSYMSKRKSTCTIQCYASTTMKTAWCGSVQEGKLSGLIYNISTNETRKLDLIIKNEIIYRRITMEDLGQHDIDHETTNFVDDSLNMIAGETVKDLEAYMRKFLTLLVHYYGAYRLKLNDKKMMIMIMRINLRKRSV